MNLVSSQPKYLAGLIILVVGTFLFGGCAPPNEPPVILSLTTNEEWVVPSGSCQVECIASDSDGDSLGYVWSASGGDIFREGSVVTWIAPDAPGAYTITVEVADGRGDEATKQLTLDVRVNQPPVIKSLTAALQVVKQAGSTSIECVAYDPDGDELSYQWTPIRGHISGQGAAVTWTAPSACGDYVVKLIVADSRGGQVSEELEFKVVKPG